MWTSTEMYHHGIGGQHWGVRNGPPYPLGIGQKIKNGGKVVVKTAKNAFKSIKKARDEKKAKKIEAKKAKEEATTKTKVPIYKKMTDEELRRAINRLRDEKTYRELTYKPSLADKGKKFLADIAERPIKNLATQIIDKQLTDAINRNFNMNLKYATNGKKDKKDD